MALARRIYRILLKETRALRNSKHLSRYAIDGTLAALEPEIRKLSWGKHVVEISPAAPTVAIRDAFRRGADSDLDTLFSFLPILIRHGRAANLIERFRSAKGVADETFKGCVLISQLGREQSMRETDLMAARIDGIIDRVVSDIEAEIERGPQSTTDRGLDENESPETRRYINTIKAYNRVMRSTEEVGDLLDADKGFFVDEVLQSQHGAAMSKGMPIVHCVIFCELMRRLNISAAGVPFPRKFMARLLPTSSPSHDMAPAGAAPTDSQPQPQALPEVLPTEALTGTYICKLPISLTDAEGHNYELPGGMQELVISFDKSQGQLTATYKDSTFFDEMGSVHKDLAWSARVPNKIIVGESVPAELQLASMVDDENQRPKLVPCTFKVVCMDAKQIGDWSPGAPFHMELVLTMDASGSIIEGSGDFDNPQEYLTLHFARSRDISRCLLSVSPSVVPLTPMQFLSFARRLGFTLTTEHLKRITQQLATSDAIITRMANNLVNTFTARKDTTMKSEYMFWRSIAHMFEEFSSANTR